MNESLDREQQRRTIAMVAERILRGTAGYRRGQSAQLAQLLDAGFTREGVRLHRIRRERAPHGFEGDGEACEREACGEGRMYYLHEREVAL